jgi:hypothetical protein
MPEQTRKKFVLSRPKGQSFEEYRDWIANTYRAMTGKAVSAEDFDEERLRQDWLKFWGQESDSDRSR